MALVNRTTGESSRSEAEKLTKPSCSVIPTSPPQPKNSPGEEKKQILSWQTISQLNRQELENSLLKEALDEMTRQMTALEEKQNLYFQRTDQTLSVLNRSVTGYELRVRQLETSNDQLSRSLSTSVNEAMSRVYDQIDRSVNTELGNAVDEVKKSTGHYIVHLDALVKSYTQQYKKTAETFQRIIDSNKTLTILFLASLAGHLIGCVQWIAHFF